MKKDIKIIHTALFCLSNVTGGAKSHIHCFFEVELLVDQVLILMRHQIVKVACEATWVLTNALTLCSEDDLKNSLRVYGQNLVHTLCDALSRLHHKETKLTLEMLQALSCLLELDTNFPNEFEGESSVAVMVCECEGFAILESLQMSDNNQEI